MVQGGAEPLNVSRAYQFSYSKKWRENYEDCVCSGRAKL